MWIQITKMQIDLENLLPLFIVDTDNKDVDREDLRNLLSLFIAGIDQNYVKSGIFWDFLRIKVGEPTQTRPLHSEILID